MIPLPPDLLDLKATIPFLCGRCRERGKRATLLVVQVGDLRDTDSALNEVADPEADFRYVAVGIVEPERRSYSAVRGYDDWYRGSTDDGTHFAFDAETWADWIADAPHQSRVRWLNYDAKWPLNLVCHRCGRTERIGKKRIAKLINDAVRADRFPITV